ncbi:hypothetical protein ACEYW6_10595 [Nostoc sp. UIC 10607]|uniref:hypothetical protein n=1 Tax=Nostoc sp. UIC 10607 TaxID=3045935 RepID=UPI0039A241D6
MPTQRIIKSTFIGLNNEPLRNATVQVIHMQGNTIDNIEYPQVTKNFITNREGQIKFTLWCNEEGERSSFYRFILPGGEVFDAVVPLGTSDLELSVLRDGGVNSADPQYQSLISYILSEVGSGVTLASSTVAGTVKTNSNSADPVVYLKSEVDSLLADVTGFDLTNYYNKSETDTALNTKANQSTTYTKAQTDALIGGVTVDLSGYYTNTQTDGLVAPKANSADVYTKSQTDTLVNAKPDTLVELTDVTISSPTNGQSLTYNASISKWINSTISSGVTGIASNISSITYDLQNRVSSYNVDGNNFTVTYNTLTTVITGGGKMRTVTYNSSGQLVSDITI